MTFTQSPANIKETAAYVIKLVAAAVNSVKAPEKPDGISWEDVCSFAEKQNVMNIISYACETLSSKPDANTMQFLREIRKQKILIEAQQQIETEDALDRLEAMGVRHMPLKGFVVKNLYPFPDMRTMSDIDILLDADRVDEVTEAFTANGFTALNAGDLHNNLIRGGIHFELHRALVNTSYKNLTSYFGSGFEKAVKCEGYNYRYELSRENMYIFLLAHLAKHYRYGGTGIRTVLDLYVYRKACPDLDMEYIYNETAKIKMDKFEHHVEEIADDWFGGGFNGEFNHISSYIISGGVYGRSGMFLVNEVINDSNGKSLVLGKIKKIFRMAFPEYELMCKLFPILKNHRMLTPFYYVFRWIKSVFGKNSNLKNTLNASADILGADDEMIAAQRAAELEEL